MKIEKVTIFGFADAKPGDLEYDATFATSRLLAEKGYTIVNGGGPGVMRAASLGAKEAKGKTIGVTLYPEEDDHMLKFEGRDKENPLDVEIKTETYLERTLKLIEEGDAFVVMNGGTGTVSEFGMSWGLARLYYGHHKPLILYGAWWHDIMESFGANMRLRPEDVHVYNIVDSPQEVIETIQKIEAEANGG